MLEEKMEAKHLKKRHQTWYLNLRVPSDLVDRVGRTDIVASLKTRDIKVANRKKHELIAGYEKYFESLRNSQDIESPLAQMKEIAKSYRQKVLAGLANEDDAYSDWCHKVDSYLAKHHNVDSEVNFNDLPKNVLDNLTIIDNVVKNPDSVLLSDAREMYLDDFRSRVANSTFITCQNRIGAFQDFIKFDKDVSHITPRECGAFVRQVIMASANKNVTKRDYISYLSAFFNYLGTNHFVDRNPFEGLSGLIKDPIKGKFDPDKRREWTRDELADLMKGLEKEGNKDFIAVTLISLYGGMRSNEVCEIELRNCFDNHMFIDEGKTANSVRGVPIHPIIKPLIQKLNATKKDRYLIPDLKRGGRDNKRNHYFVKRYSEFRVGLGFGKATVFHCLRNSFTGSLARMDLQPRVVKQIVGHAQSDITFGIYSDGHTLDCLIEIVSRISYGEEVDALAMKLVADF
jgi:integrase